MLLWGTYNFQRYFIFIAGIPAYVFDIIQSQLFLFNVCLIYEQKGSSPLDNLEDSPKNRLIRGYPTAGTHSD